MALTNSSSSYGSVTKTFHWLTALLLISTFVVGEVASDLSHQILSASFDGSQATLDRAVLLFSLHKTLGLAAFLVALGRILWALNQPKPGLLHPDNKPEALAAEVVHWLLYGAMVATPMTGWIHHAATTGFAPIWWPFGQDLPLVPKSEGFAAFFATLHWIAGKALLLAFGLHVAGALKHVVIDRDATLRRMLPGSRDLPQPPAQKHSATPAVIALAIWVGIFGAGYQIAHSSDGHAHHDHDQETAEVTAAEESAEAETGGNWTVDDGTLGITIQQMGSGVSGSFDNWSADIQFEEPATPGPAGTVTVEIDISSLNLGTVSDQAMGPDYFDESQFPSARFEAEIEKLAEGDQGGYQAVGTLTIRDKSQPLTLPFTLDLDGDHAEMTGQVSVNRMDFDIGLGTKEEGTLGFAVVIGVTLEAERRD